VNDELLSAALLGTARKQPTYEGREARLQGDPATVLLEAAALQHAYRRGAITSTTATTPPPAQDDTRYLLPAEAIPRITELLIFKSPLLPEWFQAAQKWDYRAPESMTAQLLMHAKSLAEHRANILRLAGSRGQWLAAQNPDWMDLVRPSTDNPDVWTYGTTSERKRWLTELRAADPTEAREHLQQTWDKESGNDRGALLSILEINLNAGDEPFLETALDDRRSDVRRIAANLLRQLPNSAYAGRMATRARSCVHVKSTVLRTTVTIEPPTALDDSVRRDGITEVGAMRQIIACAPLALWDELFGSAEKAIRSSIDEQNRPHIIDAWSEAAAVQRNQEWADLLLPGSIRAEQLLPVASQPARERYVLSLGDELLTAQPFNPLTTLEHPWSRNIAAHVLKQMGRRADGAAKAPFRLRDRSRIEAQRAIRMACAHLPIDAYPMARASADRCPDPGWAQTFTEIAHSLIQRKTMLEELQ
jgi:hypothetical protein